MDIKFGTDASNEMLLCAAKCQCYSFYFFWTIQEKPAGGKITPAPIRVNKKIVGKKKDEFKWKIISEFIRLKSKTYSLIDVDNEENKEAKAKCC